MKMMKVTLIKINKDNKIIQESVIIISIKTVISNSKKKNNDSIMIIKLTRAKETPKKNQ